MICSSFYYTPVWNCLKMGKYCSMCFFVKEEIINGTFQLTIFNIKATVVSPLGCELIVISASCQFIIDLTTDNPRPAPPVLRFLDDSIL